MLVLGTVQVDDLITISVFARAGCNMGTHISRKTQGKKSKKKRKKERNGTR